MQRAVAQRSNREGMMRRKYIQRGMEVFGFSSSSSSSPTSPTELYPAFLLVILGCLYPGKGSLKMITPAWRKRAAHCAKGGELARA